MKVVSYLRVSTRKQENSGLGEAAQQRMVESYCKWNDGEIIAAFRETESGKRKDRPELLKAIAYAKVHGAKLVIANVSRLARNVAFVATLIEQKTDFACCDNPAANTMNLQLMAVFAEQEARDISSRTKAGLASIKRTIAEHGSYTSKSGRTITSLGAGSGHWQDPTRVEKMKAGLAKGRSVSATMQRGSVSVNMVIPAMREMRASNLTFKQIAERLNSEGVTTRLGGKWCAGTVLRAMRPRTAA